MRPCAPALIKMTLSPPTHSSFIIRLAPPRRHSSARARDGQRTQGERALFKLARDVSPVSGDPSASSKDDGVNASIIFQTDSKTATRARVVVEMDLLARR